MKPACTQPDLRPVADRIDVKVGFACNNRCLFCVQGRKRDRYGKKARQELMDILDQNAERYTGVVFTGGEPSLHPDLLDLVARAKQVGYDSIQIQSNGRMFAYADLCERLIAAGVTEFSPALHGASPDCHDYLTQVRGSFEQTVRGIRVLKSLGQRVITNSVITRSNFRHLPELAKLLIDLGVDQYQLAFVHPVGSAGPEANFAAIVPRFELLVKTLHPALLMGLEANRVVMTEAVPFCFMGGLEQLVGERIMPSTRIFDAEGVIEDYRQYRVGEGKAKGQPCEDCSRNAECEGPWREYTDRYGWGEFHTCR